MNQISNPNSEIDQKSWDKELLWVMAEMEMLQIAVI